MDSEAPLLFGRKRVVPLTEAEQAEAAQMILPDSIAFKLNQAAGRMHRKEKVRACINY